MKKENLADGVVVYHVDRDELGLLDSDRKESILGSK
jgi:hypothetical protein